jgi:hypothetical protein
MHLNKITFTEGRKKHNIVCKIKQGENQDLLRQF